MDKAKPTDFVYIRSDSMKAGHLFGWFWWITEGDLPFRPKWVYKIGRLLIMVKPRIMVFGHKNTCGPYYNSPGQRIIEIPYPNKKGR